MGSALKWNGCVGGGSKGAVVRQRLEEEDR